MLEGKFFSLIDPTFMLIAHSSPTILFIGGHDPTGGAGIQADIETAVAHHCRAYSLVTCLTAQSTQNVQRLYPQDRCDFLQQADVLLADVNPDWVKIGLMGDVDIALAIADILAELNKPVVLDPVLAAGGGRELAGPALVRVVNQRLLPFVDLLTPNQAEARRLTGRQKPQPAVERLLDQGCGYVMLTGADESAGSQVMNTLYSQTEDPYHLTCPKLPDVYHGSGCTLASACVCQLAQHREMKEAVQAAQHFTWRSLETAEKPGQGQHLPNRRFI